jgi:hypothetical protein
MSRVSTANARRDAVEFGEWTTPFADATVDILDVCAVPSEQGHRELSARVHVCDAKTTYRLVFPAIAAFRLLDESGLLELWQKTAELGGRPGQTTFRVRNHGWSRESILSFQASDGWSFVIATADECLEVVARSHPSITAEAVSPRSAT